MSAGVGQARVPGAADAAEVAHRAEGPQADHVPGAGGADVVDALQPGAARMVDVHAAPHEAGGRRLHGGGFMIGSARTAHATCARIARELGIVVINVDYRLAPETPFPGPVEDCSAALHRMKQQADSLGIDPDRIALMGESAGAGLAAALAQLAHDSGVIEPAFQLLMHPMLGDRTALKREHGDRGEFLWAPGSNRLSRASYLGHPPSLNAAPAYAAPARRHDLSGLAPAWIGVGTLDLLFPKNAAYAERLNEAGVPCELHVVEGAYHGFESMRPNASISKAFLERSMKALRRGLRLA